MFLLFLYIGEHHQQLHTMNDQFHEIPTESLVDPWVMLRPVAKDSIEYMELFESLKGVGFLNSISVRPSSRHPDKYELIDGLWRTMCAREIGFPMVPCIIKHHVSDDDVLALQIQANAIRPETKPIEFARQIRRIQKVRPDITLGELSSMVNKKPNWVRQQLGLLRLDTRTQKSVDRGEINLSNAFMLAKIPPRLRVDFIDEAKLMSQKDFKILAASVIKNFKEAVKHGKLEDYFADDFLAQPHLRKLKDVKSEFEECLEAPLLLTAGGYGTAMEGWKAALEWVLHLDPESQRSQEIAVRKKAHKRWVKGA